MKLKINYSDEHKDIFVNTDVKLNLTNLIIRTLDQVTHGQEASMDKGENDNIIY